MPTPGIFISHSHHDNVFCRRLRDFLRQRLPDAPIYLDESELRGGDEWMRDVQQKVIEYPLFVVVLSSYSIVANWVREETNLALSRAIIEKQRRVIPVQIDPRIRLPDIDQLAPLLTTRQIIDLTESAASTHWNDLVRVLRGEVSDVSTRIDTTRAGELQQAVEYATLTHEAFAAGRWRDTIMQAQEAVKMPGNERDTTLWVEMAQAYEHLGRLDDAVAALDAALGLNRQRVDLLEQKAQLLLRMEPPKTREAIAVWSSALAHAHATPAKLDLLRSSMRRYGRQVTLKAQWTSASMRWNSRQRMLAG
jgi:tetratricopeptide (TPR) repeat protein